MLRNYRPLEPPLQVTTPFGIKESPKNFDFFNELGLLEKNKTLSKSLKAQSSSTSSSSQDSPDDDKFAFDSLEFPDLQKEGSWIEVKGSKNKSKGTCGGQKKKGGRRKKVQEQEVSSLSVEEKIASLMEMGFEKRQAIKALQTCAKDLERSVEWLIQYVASRKD